MVIGKRRSLEVRHSPVVIIAERMTKMPKEVEKEVMVAPSQVLSDVGEILGLEFGELEEFYKALMRGGEQAKRVIAGSWLDGLDEPFKDEDLEWRVQNLFIYNEKPGAVVVPYVTNRAIMNRLDEVVGKENWRNNYGVTPVTNGVMCGISILMPTGEWVTKFDGADPTSIESTKGSLSDSMKRAAVQWGIGRHLYTLPTAFAKVHERGYNKASGTVTKYEGGQKKEVSVRFRWDAPTMKEVFETDARRRSR